jgi:hypothetical protein
MTMESIETLKPVDAPATIRAPLFPRPAAVADAGKPNVIDQAADAMQAARRLTERVQQIVTRLAGTSPEPTKSGVTSTIIHSGSLLGLSEDAADLVKAVEDATNALNRLERLI